MQERGRRNWRYRDDQGGLLAWKLCTGKLVVGGVVLLFGRNLGVYRKRMPEGEEISNGQTDATICMKWL